MIFNLNTSNQLLLNPKISSEEAGVLNELKAEFEQHFGKQGFFLIASSGSSQKQNESVKLIALSVQSVLNSAKRFVKYFNVEVHENWGLVLPEFHVAGLGVYARAHIAGSQVFKKDWSVSGVGEWILQNEIHFMSLVPAQVFDLVQNKIKAPISLKKVFVGAGSLNSDIKKQVLALGWPVVETYGMTETCSMIAVNESNGFKIMPEVQVKSDNGHLSIKCDSLLTASLQKRENQLVVKSFEQQDWFSTEDVVEISVVDSSTYLKFMGRAGDYIKILGEGVSLNQLRDQLSLLLFSKQIKSQDVALLAVADIRNENKLILAVENSVAIEAIDDVINLFNLQCRPYEKISHRILVKRIPRTELGKLKNEELKRIVELELNRGSNG